jgi:hypothetical protein
MNHIQILKRSWNILWSYKTLWVFGILLALTTAEGFTSPNNGSRVTVSPDTQQWQPIPAEELRGLPEDIRAAVEELDRELTNGIPSEVVNTIIGVAIALVCLVLVIMLVSAVVHYVSQTALIRMVDRYEATGEKVNWRAGFRLGWSRSAWRMFLIDLLIFLAVFVVVVLLFAVAAVPVLLSILLGGLAVIAGIVMTIGMGMLAIFAVILVGALLAMAREVIYRECVLRGRGVVDSIGSGVRTLRANIKNVFLLWLLLLAIQIIYFVAAIPVVIILLALGLVVGGVVGALLYLALQAGSVLTAILVAAAVGLLLLAVVIGLPMLFLRGLRETYLSTAWTLGYREIPAPDSAGAAS